MLSKIKMPDVGKTTSQITILRWHKKEGNLVNRGDILLEVETDKSAVEVESYAKGYLLKILVKEGETITVGEPIAYIGEKDDLLAETDYSEVVSKKLEEQDWEPSRKISEEVDDYRPIIQSKENGGIETFVVQQKSVLNLEISPAAKKAAKDKNVNLDEVYRIFNKDKIKRKDIEIYIKETYLEKKKKGLEQIELQYEDTVITNMRKTIATRLSHSAFTIPTFSAEIEVDMSLCIELRNELNSHLTGIKIAFHDLITKCIAVCAQKFPYINASYLENSIRLYKNINIGLAVTIENGLVVPVVKNVQSKSLSEIAKENSDNISLVRSGNMKGEILEDGTITISNLGMYPINRFNAIINPPQSSILALGSICTRSVWNGVEFIGKPIMYITGTFDHRLIDGAYGAEFLKELKDIIEHPSKLLL